MKNISKNKMLNIFPVWMNFIKNIYQKIVMIKLLIIKFNKL